MLVVVNMETGDILVSDRVPALSTTTLLKMDDLKAEQNLKLEIISFNSLGNATSASVNFGKGLLRFRPYKAIVEFLHLVSVFTFTRYL